ncbi:lipase secretion chaperone, partial [Salmonella enterica]|uniref:lipase secretion chaperone n=1 Tax=Salmonella enterica TaxID=28901 RepID=UPI00329908A6
ATPGKDAAALFEERKKAYGEPAAQRLAQADAEWADWERRLAGAKRKWADVQADAGLTPPLRKAEMDRYVEANFKREEFLRVQALLNL